MNKNDKLFVLGIAFLTALLMYILPLVPDFLGPVEADDIVGFQPAFITVFLLFNVIFIGIPAWIHRKYVKDYSKIKNVWFFVLFGGITGAYLGEIVPHGASLLLIIPYILLMLIYVQFYKRFAWWKVALTAYMGGIFVENVINRSPIQIPTLMWIAFFIYPYFYTKIWENRGKVPITYILKDLVMSFISLIKSLKQTIAVSILLGILAAYASRDNTSPPLILFGIVLPFIVTLVYRIIKKR